MPRRPLGSPEGKEEPFRRIVETCFRREAGLSMPLPASQKI